METSLKTDFAQIFSRCPKKSELPKIWGGLQPPSPPRPVRLCVKFAEIFTFQTFYFVQPVQYKKCLYYHC